MIKKFNRYICKLWTLRNLRVPDPDPSIFVKYLFKLKINQKNPKSRIFYFKLQSHSTPGTPVPRPDILNKCLPSCSFIFSGSGSRTNNSGSGSRKKFRIRLHNTVLSCTGCPNSLPLSLCIPWLLCRYTTAIMLIIIASKYAARRILDALYRGKNDLKGQYHKIKGIQ